MSDEIGSGDSLVSVVQVSDASVSPSVLDIPVHNVALDCGFVLSRISVNSDEVIGYKSPVFQDNSLTGGRCGNRASPEMLFPDMSGTTSTDEGETIEVSVGVVSCCDRGKVPYQYCRNGYGYFMKNILSSLDPPGSVLSWSSTPISCSSIV